MAAPVWGVPRAVRLRQPTATPSPDLKTCRGCFRKLPRDAYAPYGTRRRAICLECEQQAKPRKPRAPEPPEQIHDRHLRRTYGITLAQYEWMLAGQGGVCAICGKPERARVGINGLPTLRRMHVDHDHETTLIRGILCHTCNVGIGSLMHDPVILQAAIHYLKRSATRRRKTG